MRAIGIIRRCDGHSCKKLFWTDVKMAPADPILGLNIAYKADQSPNKVNLGVGAYRGDDGQPHVLESVRRAEELIFKERLDHEYSDIGGSQDFIQKALVFAYGQDSPALASKRIAAVQTLSGTGACRVTADFISKFRPQQCALYLPSPTWGNHLSIVTAARLLPLRYRYYNQDTKTFDFEGLKIDILSAPSQSAFLLHSCAHNPTGFDPSRAQWDELSALMKSKDHIVFFDNAYQGFASGDSEQDAYSIRKFVKDGHRIVLAQSFAKNFGLYGDRVGLLSFVTRDEEEAQRVTSQLKTLIRPMYSSPPLHGARIVSRILGDAQLKALWQQECAEMAERIKMMRVSLRERLEREGGDWSHVTAQIGMFCFTGLGQAQVQALKSDFHIYCTSDGRISMAGLNLKNLDHVASSILAVATKVHS